MPSPVSSKSLVVESSDKAQSSRARNVDNILPFFIPLKNVFRRLSDTSLDISMLEDSPHILNSIYTENSMST
jgi:hypothetical protein